MASLSIHFECRADFGELACLAGIDERMNEAMRETGHDGTDLIHQGAVGNIPKRTGRTAGTIDSAVVDKANGATGYVGSDDLIARILEYGSRPHVIEGNPTLFVEGSFVRRVNHPGTRPYDWLLNAAEGAGPAILGIAEGHVAAALAC